MNWDSLVTAVVVGLSAFLWTTWIIRFLLRL
jgi:hypothetical protein